MAQDGETPKAVDKGKGKAVEDNAARQKDAQNGTEKSTVNGKADEPVLGGRYKSDEVQCTALIHL